MIQGDSGLISMIYAIASFVWIVLGFKLRNEALFVYQRFSRKIDGEGDH